jgi:hypothetical protein
MYLIKAEALLAQGNTAAAQTEFNRVHNLHDSANPVTVSRDAILKERLLEFSGEGKRRSDMIRHGKFLSWTEASAHGHTDKSSQAFRLLFPISSNSLGSNPLLTQNPGY